MSINSNWDAQLFNQEYNRQNAKSNPTSTTKMPNVSPSDIPWWSAGQQSGITAPGKVSTTTQERQSNIGKYMEGIDSAPGCPGADGWSCCYTGPTSPVKESDYRNDANAAKYGAYRNSGVPHGGIDFYPADAYVGEDGSSNGLFGSDGTAINTYAMANGTVVAYTSGFIGTDAIIVNHGDYFALYGEIKTDLRVGDIVSQGQLLGPIELSAENTLMLHLEILINYPASSGFLGGTARKSYQIDPTYVYDYPDFRS